MTAQQRRRRNGQYDNGPRCYCCGKPAGFDYFSHSLTDSTGTDGEAWGDTALVLCPKCSIATADITTVAEFESFACAALAAAGVQP